MAFINAEDVKAIRNELKVTFPKFKFGVKKRDYSAVDVTIKSGPTDFSDCFRAGDNGHAQINHYHTHMYGEHKDFFDAVHKIIKTAPITAPISELLPPTAAQTTIEIENEMSKKVGEANSAATT